MGTSKENNKNSRKYWLNLTFNSFYVKQNFKKELIS
jgi:hypothetical protein